MIFALVYLCDRFDGDSEHYVVMCLDSTRRQRERERQRRINGYKTRMVLLDE